MKKLLFLVFFSVITIFSHPEQVLAQKNNDRLQGSLSQKAEDAGSIERWQKTGSNLFLVLIIVLVGMTITIVMLNSKKKQN